MRTFVHNDGHRSRFWNIDLRDDHVTVTAGPLYRKGRTKTRRYADADQARAAHARLVRRKVGAGYVETTPAPVPPLQRALEEALVADPDDLAAHMAYADYLAERGDPRGELIQLELAHERLPAASGRRAALRKRAQELIAGHGRDWLGGLAPYLLEQSHTYAVPFRLVRGWLDTLYVERLNVGLARTVAGAPQARLLRLLRIDDVLVEGPGDYQPGDDTPTDEEHPSLAVLFASPFLANLRRLQLRAFDLGEEAVRDVVCSPHLARLRQLELHDPQLGTAGLEAVIESGVLRRLTVLDLEGCGLRDHDAGRLAGADLGNLELLNLDRNRLTEDGIRALRQTGVPLQAADQGEDVFDEDWE